MIDMHSYSTTTYSTHSTVQQCSTVVRTPINCREINSNTKIAQQRTTGEWAEAPTWWWCGIEV
jgi:hypothetical protein